MNTGQEQQRRIWTFNVGHDARWLTIHCTDTAQLDIPLYTSTQLRDLVHEHVETSNSESVVKTVFIVLRFPLTEQDSAELGLSCQPLLQHLKEFRIFSFVDDVTEEDVSRILGHMSLSSSRIERLKVQINFDKGLPTIMRLFHDFFPSSLRTLVIWNAQFSSEDCLLLDRIISKKENQLWDLQFPRCFFPSLADLLAVLAGFVKDKIPSDDCFFGPYCSFKLTDYTMPHFNGTESGYLENRSTVVDFFQRRMDTEDPLTDLDVKHRLCLENAVRDFFNYFLPMQRAGLQNVYKYKERHDGNNEMQNVHEESDGENNDPDDSQWVKVFAHKDVNHRVDLLFHILKLNPLICARRRSLKRDALAV